MLRFLVFVNSAPPQNDALFLNRFRINSLFTLRPRFKAHVLPEVLFGLSADRFFNQCIDPRSVGLQRARGIIIYGVKVNIITRAIITTQGVGEKDRALYSIRELCRRVACQRLDTEKRCEDAVLALGVHISGIPYRLLRFEHFKHSAHALSWNGFVVVFC